MDEHSIYQHSIQFNLSDTQKLFNFSKYLLSERIEKIDRLSLVGLKNEAGLLLGYEGESGKNVFAEGEYRYRIPYSKFLFFCQQFNESKIIKPEVKRDFKKWKEHIDKLYNKELESYSENFVEEDEEHISKYFSKSLHTLDRYYAFFKGIFPNEAIFINSLNRLVAKRNQDIPKFDEHSSLFSEDQKVLYAIENVQKDFFVNLFSKRWIIYEEGDNSIIYRSIDFIYNSYHFLKSDEPSEFKEYANLGRENEELLDVPPISKFSNYDLDKFFYDPSQQAIFIRNSYEEQEERNAICIYAFKIASDDREKYLGLNLLINSVTKEFKFRKALLCHLPEELEDSCYNISRYDEIRFSNPDFPEKIKSILETFDYFKHELFPLIMLHASHLLQREIKEKE